MLYVQLGMDVCSSAVGTNNVRKVDFDRNKDGKTNFARLYKLWELS